MRTIPIGTLNEMFLLDSDTGLIYWRERPASHFPAGINRTPQQIANNINSRQAGKMAFTSKSEHGHLRAEVGNKLLQAGRVAYALFHGFWPENFIDHINGNPADNRPSNLRNVTHAENMRNTSRRSDNTSGTNGVRLRGNKLAPNKWQVAITAGAVRITKEFTSFEDAICARKNLESQYGFHENHGRKST